MKILGKIFLVVSLTLIAAEVLLRLAYQVTYGPEQSASFQLFRETNYAVWRVWTQEENKAPFLPPYLLYSNTDLDNAARLKMIYESTRLPPSQTWTSYDFLQPRRSPEETKYTVHSNALGFRGREASATKKRGVFRIIALGAYHVFGHGVEDAEAYPAVLEQVLNAKSKSNSYEVWNGGRHAGTAIIALARLQNELLLYKPDMFIFDYGIVDELIYRDNFMPVALMVPGSRTGLLLRKAFRGLLPLLERSLLFFKLVQNFGFTPAQHEKNIEDFRQTMRKILAICKQQNVPVLLVRQDGLKIPPSAYETLIDDPARVGFLDLSAEFYFHPPTYEQEREFSKRPNWLSHFPPQIRRTSQNMENGPYRLDYFQLSPLGHRVLATTLAKMILERQK